MSKRVCSVCCQQQARYTCPRCHKVYCSSACYKQHSSTCSEAFYREQATSQLKATRAEPQQTQQMLEVLQRLHQQQAADDSSWLPGAADAVGSDSSADDDSDAGSSGAEEEEDELISRLPDPASKRLVKQLLKRAAEEGPAFAVRPSDLSPELISALEGLNLRGQLSHLVTPWNPWWDTHAAAALQLNVAGQRVVQDLEQLHRQVNNHHHQQQQQLNRGGEGVSQNIVSAAAAAAGEGAAEESAALPQPPEEALPTLQVLAGQGHKPSPLLPWQLLQLLVAYCAVLRQFNGDPEVEGGWEAAQLLLLLAPPLVQAALAGSSSSSRVTPPSAPARSGPSAADSPVQEPPAASSQADRAQQQQQVQQYTVGSILPPDSVRLACLQLLEAAAASDAAAAAGSGDGQQEQLAATAAAVSGSSGSSVSPERRALLQVAEADALKLLQLGRSAVLLALTDTRRLLLGAKERVKQAVQQQGGKGQQQQKQRRLLQQLRQGLGLAGQKVWYFMAWANEQGPGVYQMLADELGRELQGQQAMLSQPVTGVTLTGNPVAVGVSRLSEPVQQRAIEVLAEAANPASGADAGQPVAVTPVASGLYDLD